MIKCTVHSQKRSIENIDFINFLRSNDTYSPCHGIPLYDLAQLMTFLVGELLGIVQFFILVIRRKNHSRRIDTACQTATTGLIATGLYLPFKITAL